jgi:H+/Cl- antiporter ClcA
MTIIELKERTDLANDMKLSSFYAQFSALLNELRKKQLNDELIKSINAFIETINASTAANKEFKKLVKQAQTAIVKQVEKEHKIVPKNHYRNLWMLLGFTTFGLPIGLAFGLSVGNIGLMAVGLPIGMAIGAAVGSSMDKKAEQEGRQLGVEISQ